MAEWTVKVPLEGGDATVIQWDGGKPDEDGTIRVLMSNGVQIFLKEEVEAFIEMAIVGGFVQGVLGRDDD